MRNTIVATGQLAEVLSYWATTAGIIVAIVGGATAYLKYRRDHATHEWDRAHESYRQFVDLAITHSEFYSGYWSEVASADRMGRNKYRWFMARFLWACEEILLCTSDDRAWRESLMITLLEHVDYLASPEGRDDMRGYYDPVQQLVADALELAASRGAAPATAEQVRPPR